MENDDHQKTLRDEKALGKFIEDMDIMNFRVQLDLSTQECDCAPRRRMRQIGQLDTSTVSCNLTMQEIDEALAVTEAAAREEETSKIEQPQVKEEEKSCQNLLHKTSDRQDNQEEIPETSQISLRLWTEREGEGIGGRAEIILGFPRPTGFKNEGRWDN
ncbi:hypothetical protein JZ751_014979 [Albula glossodonta]|uniref:Uncharacterized protein n=1 Tax=Albula glossodonta TaxID=121402 RepID=A0A8T2MXG0_9TELE|nr:hypothetical protein JZ751_014979 [Albula glossodonta]